MSSIYYIMEFIDFIVSDKIKTISSMWEYNNLYGLFILQSSSCYPYVAQAHTAIPVSLLSDYQGISQLP